MFEKLAAKSGYLLQGFCQPFDEDAAHGHVEESLPGLGQPFIIFGKTSVAGGPSECSFNDPAAR
jgi:hypothetical protein